MDEPVLGDPVAELRVYQRRVIKMRQALDAISRAKTQSAAVKRARSALTLDDRVVVGMVEHRDTLAGWSR